MDINKNLEQIIEYCTSFAKRMLSEEEKEFYPFGAFINNLNELVPVGVDSGYEEFPKSKDVIDNLREFSNKELKSNKIKAFAIAYDVRVTDDENGQKSDALLIDITHKDKNNIPVYYYHYSWNSENKLEFEKGYGIKR